MSTSHDMGACEPCNLRAKCPECGRVFDLANEDDAEEWHYGHDCEDS